MRRPFQSGLWGFWATGKSPQPADENVCATGSFANFGIQAKNLQSWSVAKRDAPHLTAVLPVTISARLRAVVVKTGREKLPPTQGATEGGY
jgi:hypothetical protein